MNVYSEDWTEQALCRQADPDAWYPEKESDPHDVITAKRICMFSCPVALECLDEAMRSEKGLRKQYRFGVRGGLTAKAREAYEPQWLAEQEVSAA